MAKNKHNAKRHKDGYTQKNQRRAEQERKDRARRERGHGLDYRPPNCFLCKQPMVPVKECKPVKCGNEKVNFTVLKCFNCWPSQFPDNFIFPTFKEGFFSQQKQKRDYTAKKNQYGDWTVYDHFSFWQTYRTNL